jgi:hypothetical protein
MMQREAAERFGIQLPRARRDELQKPNDLAREAVSCNAGLGRRIVAVERSDA